MINLLDDLTLEDLVAGLIIHARVEAKHLSSSLLMEQLAQDSYYAANRILAKRRRLQEYRQSKSSNNG